MSRTIRTALALLGATTTVACAVPGVANAAPAPYERGTTTAAEVQTIAKHARVIPVPGTTAARKRTHVVRYAGGIRKRQDAQGRMVGYHLSPYGRG